MTKDKYLIMRDRKVMLSPCYWNMISQTSFEVYKIYKTNLKFEWQHFKEGRCTQFYLNKNWKQASDFISKKILNDKNFIKKLLIKLKQGEGMINEFFKKNKKLDYKNLTFKELINTANKIKKLWLKYDCINVPVWYIGGDKFQKIVNDKLNIPEQNFLFLTTPIKKTAVSQLEYELLKYARLVKKNKKNIEKIAEKLSQDYGWIPFGYDGLEYWDKKYFIKKLSKEAKNFSKKTELKIKIIEKIDKKNLKKRNDLIKKYNLNKQQVDLIDKINILAIWTDERKKIDFQLHYYYSQILLEFKSRYNIPYLNLKYLFTEEFNKIEKDINKILQLTNNRIKNDFIVEFKNGKGGIISENKKNKILKKLENQTKESEIKGTVASKGIKNIYQGKVRVLFSSNESDKVKNGDFLVATMTTPDYIISMKKTVGFITDEGGITCHAAIVAREMNKPCIIGTKIATKVLKDGDLVEVDAERGIVKILKRANK